MSGTPLLRSVTPDNCSNSWAIGTPKSSIENLDPQVSVCSTERLFWHAGDKEKEFLDLNAVLEANPDSLEFLRLRARALRSRTQAGGLCHIGCRTVKRYLLDPSLELSPLTRSEDARLRVP
jgi:hypothetical protein